MSEDQPGYTFRGKVNLTGLQLIYGRVIDFAKAIKTFTSHCRQPGNLVFAKK